MSTTLDYYNANAEEFVRNTRNVDFSAMQDLFLRRLPECRKILDLGCGSGRDSRCFLDRGYKVTAVDGSEELCRLASEYIGQPVLCRRFEEFETEERFDGIWACASLLHLDEPALKTVLNRLSENLKASGCLYVSFKYGDFRGEKNGRFFRNWDENSFAELMREVPGLCIESLFVTEDVRQDRPGEKWLNAILRAGGQGQSFETTYKCQ